MQTGTRGRTPVSPMNRTGQIFARQQREQAELAERKAEAERVDPHEIRKTAYMDGWSVGYDAGYEAALKAFEALEDEPSAEGE